MILQVQLNPILEELEQQYTVQYIKADIHLLELHGQPLDFTFNNHSVQPVCM